jgi:putative pantetheine hydrolase
VITPPVTPGPANALVDVAGLRVGHHQARTAGYLSGTTVVLAPDGGMVAGVDVRGGGPGTRETDLLSPMASVERVHAIVLTGGSAYGLASASGVADALGERGIGLQVGPLPDQVVPIVPSAVLFDLGRGGDFAARPDESFGRAAVQAALEVDPAAMAACGCVGAGTGAVAGGLKGAVGGASAVLPDGTTVAALMVANAVGSTVEPRTGTLWGASLLLPGDGPRLAAPTAADREALLAAATAPSGGPSRASAGHTMRNTTIGVLAIDATLTKAQCTKLAAVGHDGLARAVNPIHTLFDGDTLFAVSSAGRPAPDIMGYQMILAAAADVVSRAMVRAMLAAGGVQTAGGQWSSYLELAPSALATVDGNASPGSDPAGGANGKAVVQ